MQRPKQKFQKRVIIRRAKEYRRSGNISAAVELLENALTQWPADRDLNLALSGMHQSNCDWNAFFKMYENAESVLYPGNLVIKWRYGIALMGSSRFDEAITKFQYVINNWDSHNESPQILGNAHACLGICYAILGEWSKIEAELITAQSIYPGSVDLHFGWIIYFIGTNQLSKISVLLDQEINQRKHYYTLYYWKAHLTQYTFNDITGSLKWYQASLKRLNARKYRRNFQLNYCAALYYASPIDVLKAYIEALIKVGKTKDALWQIRWQKLRRLYKNLDANALRIYFDILTGDHEKAEISCLEKLAQNPVPEICCDYYVLLAQAQSRQSKFIEARQSIQTAIKIDPDHPDAWEILGVVEVKEHNWSAGIEIYQRLVKMKPFEAEYWHRLGECYYKSQDFEQARTHYERASTLLPHNSKLWKELGDTYSALNLPQEAQSAYKKAAVPPNPAWC